MDIVQIKTQQVFGRWRVRAVVTFSLFTGTSCFKFDAIFFLTHVYRRLIRSFEPRRRARCRGRSVYPKNRKQNNHSNLT